MAVIALSFPGLSYNIQHLHPVKIDFVYDLPVIIIICQLDNGFGRYNVSITIKLMDDFRSKLIA